jgi:hypothetical protein
MGRASVSLCRRAQFARPNKSGRCLSSFFISDFRQLHLPSTRADVDVIFAQIAGVLRRGGRPIPLLPAFEMSLVTRDAWKMRVDIDLEKHRE